ncbi:MAG: hypothetical protein ABFC89_12375 [Methanospirillum sp.]
MKPIYSLCAVALLAGLLVMGAGAVTVTVDKHDYKSGEIISSKVAGMTDGTNYSMKVSVDQFMKAGMPSAFGNTNITWPFAHRDDSFNITNVNTSQNSVTIGHWWPPEKGGSYEQAVFNGTSVNGVFTRTFHYENDQTGNYTSKWLATPAAGASIVTSIFQINGTKLSGPNDFTVESSIVTVNPAVAWVEIYANNVLVSRERFTFDAAPVPTNFPTLGPGSDSDSYPGSSGTIATVTTSVTGTMASGTTTPVGTGGTTTGGATPVGTATPQTTGNATATTTAPPAGSPFAFAALGALGCAALLLAGRARR